MTRPRRSLAEEHRGHRARGTQRAEHAEDRAGAPGDAYERLRGARDDGDLAKQETRALRDKVRQLEAENAFLRQQLEALQSGRGSGRPAPATVPPPTPMLSPGAKHAREG